MLLLYMQACVAPEYISMYITVGLLRKQAEARCLEKRITAGTEQDLFLHGLSARHTANGTRKSPSFVTTTVNVVIVIDKRGVSADLTTRHKRHVRAAARVLTWRRRWHHLSGGSVVAVTQRIAVDVSQVEHKRRHGCGGRWFRGRGLAIAALIGQRQLSVILSRRRRRRRG